MALVESEALVLKSYNLAEADKIVVLFTRDHGIVRGVAKGAKRLKSKFGSGLEPFTIARVTYFQKEVLELVSIQRTDLVRSFFAAASDPDFLARFSFLTDLLVSISPPHDPNETLYRMVKACLETADEDKQNLRSVGVYFELWLLRLAGYLPEIGRCGKCGSEISTSASLYLSSEHQLVCEKCRRYSAPPALSGGQRDLINKAFKLGPGEFASEAKNFDNELEDISSVLRSLIYVAIGRAEPSSQVRALNEIR